MKPRTLGDAAAMAVIATVFLLLLAGLIAASGTCLAHGHPVCGVAAGGVAFWLCAFWILSPGDPDA